MVALEIAFRLFGIASGLGLKCSAFKALFQVNRDDQGKLKDRKYLSLPRYHLLSVVLLPSGGSP